MIVCQRFHKFKLRFNRFLFRFFGTWTKEMQRISHESLLYGVSFVLCKVKISTLNQQSLYKCEYLSSQLSHLLLLRLCIYSCIPFSNIAIFHTTRRPPTHITHFISIRKIVFSVSQKWHETFRRQVYLLLAAAAAFCCWLELRRLSFLSHFIVVLFTQWSDNVVDSLRSLAACAICWLRRSFVDLVRFWWCWMVVVGIFETCSRRLELRMLGRPLWSMW